MQHKIKVLGHRGAMKEGFYENTTDGLTTAMAIADGFETDAVRTADGDVFLIHDTDATTGAVHYEFKRHLTADCHAQVGERRTDQLSAAEMAQLRLMNGQPIPRLADLLASAKAYPHALLNIELKSHDTAQAVARMLEESGLPSTQVFVSSFNHPELLKFRTLAPQYKIGLLLLEEAKPAPLPMFDWLNTDKDAYYHPFRADYLRGELVQRIKPDYIGLNSLDLSANTMTTIAAALPEAQTYVWWYALYDSNPHNIPESTFELLANLNRDKQNIIAVITSHPKKMKDVLGARGLR